MKARHFFVLLMSMFAITAMAQNATVKEAAETAKAAASLDLDSIDDVFTDAEGKQHTLAELKGKTIYIDFWASWCGPCRGEIPYLKALEERTLAEREDVVFVSISVDQQEAAWKAAIKTNELHGNQWHITSMDICKRLNITGIPRFVVFGADGKLSVYSAKRPSQMKTFEY